MTILLSRATAHSKNLLSSGSSVTTSLGHYGLKLAAELFLLVVLVEWINLTFHDQAMPFALWDPESLCGTCEIPT